MIQFNEVRVSRDNKCLIVDVQVSPLSYYDDVYLDTVYVDVLSSDNCSLGVPSSNPLFTEVCDENTKHFRKVFDIDGLANKVFLVYVTTTGEPAEGTPCGCGMKTKIACTYAYNKYPLYLAIMPLLQSIGGCDPSRELIDSLLRLLAFNLSMNIGDYCTAITYWDEFLGNSIKKDCSKPRKKCGCHGRY